MLREIPRLRAEGLIMRIMLLLPVLFFLQELPPPYPRAGATALFENDRVVVWDIAWLRQEYPQHRHRYDMTGVYYSSGDRVIISPEGERRPVSTEAWNVTFQRAGVTHSEEGASDQPLRAVFTEMKQPSMGALPSEPGAPLAFPLTGATLKLNNDRVVVWELNPAMGQRQHRHPRETVVVTFDAAGRPQARYVERGTVHESDVLEGTTRAFAFEIK